LNSADRQTIFSPCRRYRYTLWREWDMFNPSYAMFIGLNPSTADEVKDDPTIRRCIGFAKEWGYGALCMTNIFAFRATDPRDMKAEPDPVGPNNDQWLAECAKNASIVIAAWGAHGKHQARDEKVLKLIGNVNCLGITREGHPRHPLYLLKTVKPQQYGGDRC
jgi:hypothetical protein